MQPAVVSLYEEATCRRSGGDIFLHGITAISANDIWAVRQSGGGPTNFEMHWNGTQWSIVPSPNITRNGSSANQLDGVTVSGPTSLWAAGTSENFGHGNRGLSTLTIHTTKG